MLLYHLDNPGPEKKKEQKIWPHKNFKKIGVYFYHHHCHYCHYHCRNHYSDHHQSFVFTCGITSVNSIATNNNNIITIQGCCLRQFLRALWAPKNHKKLGACATFLGVPPLINNSNLICPSFKFPKKCLFVYQWKFFAYRWRTQVLHFCLKSAKRAGNSVVPTWEVGIEEAIATRIISFRCVWGLFVLNFSCLRATFISISTYIPTSHHQSHSFIIITTTIIIILSTTTVPSPITNTIILRDPGADKGGEGKSKRAEKYIWNNEK